MIYWHADGTPESHSSDRLHQILSSLYIKESLLPLDQYSLMDNTTVPISANAFPTADALWNASPLALAASSLLIIFGTSYVYKLAAASENQKTIHAIGGFPIANAWRFFAKRGDFLRTNFEKGHELFSFKVLHVSVAFDIKIFSRFFGHLLEHVPEAQGRGFVRSKFEGCLLP